MNSPVSLLYKDIKNVFQYEKYLDLLPSSLRHYISRIRLSAHPLLIQSGRNGSNRIPRNERFCIYCSLHDIEDEEYHFVLVCTCYNDLRKKYIQKFYYVRPSMYKFLELLNSDNKIILRNLACYIREALAMRISVTHEFTVNPLCNIA